MSGFPLKKRATLIKRKGCGGLSGTLSLGSIQSFDEYRHVPVPTIPVAFGEEDSRSNPSKTVIAALPALDLHADLRHCGKTRFELPRSDVAFGDGPLTSIAVSGMSFKVRFR